MADFKEHYLSRHLSELEGKKVVHRVDINVPVKNKKMAGEHFKIDVYAAIIDRMVKHGLIPVVMTHLGRKEEEPEGKFLPYLDEMYRHLDEKTKSNLLYAPDLISERTKRTINKAKVEDAVFIVENTRNNAEEGLKTHEEMINSGIAEFYRERCEAFIMDAPATMHREATTISGLGLVMPSYLGFQAEKEIEALNRIVYSSELTYIILGGEKDKLEMVEPILKLPNARMFFAGVPGEVYKMVKNGLDAFSEKDVELLSKREADIVLMKKLLNVYGSKIDGPLDFKEYENKIACMDQESEERLLGQLLNEEVARIIFIGPPDRYELEEEEYCRIRHLVDPLLDAGKEISAMGGNTIDMFGKAGYKEDGILFFTGGGSNVAYLAGNPKKLPGLHLFMNDKQLKANSIHGLK